MLITTISSYMYIVSLVIKVPSNYNNYRDRDVRKVKGFHDVTWTV